MRLSRHRTYGVLPVLLLSWLLCSCGPLHPGLTGITGIPLSEGERDSLFESLALKTREVHTLQLLFSGISERERERTTMRYAFLHSSPAQSRLEVFPVNGAYSLALFATDGERSTFLDVTEKRAIIGSEHEELLRRELSLPIPQDAIPMLLVARIPEQILTQLRSSPETLCLRDSGTRSYTLRSAQGDYQFRIDGESMLLHTVEHQSLLDGLLDWTMQFGPSRATDGLNLPSELTLRLPQHDTTLRLELVKGHANRKVSEQLFSIPIPANFRLQPATGR